jgi:hypothetical protein
MLPQIGFVAELPLNLSPRAALLRWSAFRI